MYAGIHTYMLVKSKERIWSRRVILQGFVEYLVDGMGIWTMVPMIVQLQMCHLSILLDILTSPFDEKTNLAC